MKVYSICLVAVLALNQPISIAKNIGQVQFVSDTESRDVKNFHAVSSGGPFNVKVKIGSKESLEIKGAQEDLNRIETIVQNGVLKIRLKRGINDWNVSTNKVEIYITAVKLDGLMLSGSGNIDLDGTLASASADIQLSGSGKINANLDTQTAGIAISGSGSVDLGGKTGSVNISISGSGGVNAQNMIAEKCQVQIAGSGNVFLNSKEELNATLIGSGSVKYKGNPTLSVNKIGSGNVTKL